MRKTILYLVISIFLISIITSCTAGGTSQTYTFDSTYRYSNLKLNSAEKPWSLKIDNENKRSGEGSIRFELRGGDGYKSSSRCELHDGRRFRAYMNTDTWYGFSMYIPKNHYPVLESAALVCGQWHQNSKSGFPPLYQKYNVLEETLVINLIPANFWTASDGSKQYTKDRGLWKIKNFKMDEWNDLVYNINWSKKDDGYLNVWHNGKQLIKFSGQTYYHGETKGPYFKFGLYIPGIDASMKSETHIIYFDEYRRGRSYEEVDPSQNDRKN